MRKNKWRYEDYYTRDGIPRHRYYMGVFVVVMFLLAVVIYGVMWLVGWLM